VLCRGLKLCAVCSCMLSCTPAPCCMHACILASLPQALSFHTREPIPAFRRAELERGDRAARARALAQHSTARALAACTHSTGTASQAGRHTTTQPCAGVRAAAETAFAAAQLEGARGQTRARAHAAAVSHARHAPWARFSSRAPGSIRLRLELPMLPLRDRPRSTLANCPPSVDRRCGSIVKQCTRTGVVCFSASVVTLCCAPIAVR
jgi:hypothetical protein